MQVCGDVRLLIGAAFSLVTDCLQWHAAAQELAANTPVVVQMGNLQAEGHGFLGSLAAERFELHDQVRARWGGP
jgi:lipopolysaccharide export system protein LptC